MLLDLRLLHIPHVSSMVIVLRLALSALEGAASVAEERDWLVLMVLAVVLGLHPRGALHDLHERLVEDGLRRRQRRVRLAPHTVRTGHCRRRRHRLHLIKALTAERVAAGEDGGSLAGEVVGG